MQRLDASELARGRRLLSRRDPALGAWMALIETPTLSRRYSYFASLVRAITAQQLSNKAAATICGRLFEGTARTRGPTVQGLRARSDADLRGAGLSRQKVRYVRALCDAFGEGHLRGYRFAAACDEQVVQDLVKVPGVGVWTAQMFLIFNLHRPDVFSPGDLALRNGLMRLQGCDGLSPQQCAERAQRWAPYRSVASLYLWRIAHFKGPGPGEGR